MAFPNIENELNKIYQPPMSLGEAMDFLNKTGLYNEKPVDFNDAIKEEQVLQSNALTLAEKKRKEEEALRDEEIRKEVASNLVNEGGGTRSAEEILSRYVDVAAKKGDIDSVLKGQSELEKAKNNREKDITDAVNRAKVAAIFNPAQALEKLKQFPGASDALGLNENTNPFSLLPMMSGAKGSKGYMVNGNYLETMSAPIKEKKADKVKFPKMIAYVDNNTNEVSSYNINDPAEAILAAEKARDPVSYSPIKIGEVKDYVKKKQREEVKASKAESSNSKSFLSTITDMFRGSPSPTPTPTPNSVAPVTGRVLVVRRKNG